jgi:hypothetical protein
MEKLNDKQVDDLCKLLGGVSLASLIGLAVGASGHGVDISKMDMAGLAFSFITCTMIMLLLRKGR